jgi:putative oxidoreductase
MNSTFTKILSFILAAVLITHGLNEFFHFNFMPVLSVPEEALNFQNSLSATGYLLPVLGVVEVFIALLLLMRKWVPFALILLAPISINVLLFHIFLNVSGIWIALITVAINILLIYKYWKAYRPLFQ